MVFWCCLQAAGLRARADALLTKLRLRKSLVGAAASSQDDVVAEPDEASSDPEVESTELLHEIETGNMVKYFAKHCINKALQLGKDIGALVRRLPTSMLLGCACSGTGSWAVVTDAVVNAMSEISMTPLHCSHLWACESNPRKQEWLKSKSLTSHSCIFADLSTMHKQSAYCVVHDKECEVKHVFGVAIGTSCTSASRYNVKSGSVKGLLDDDEVENATFDSWRAACRFLKVHRPSCGLLENVPELDSKDDDNDSNLDVGLSMIREAGFWAHHIVLHTDKYLLPQCRRRIYIFAINMTDAGMGPIPHNFGKTLEQTLRAMEHAAVPYSELLLPADSAEMTKELGRLQDMKDERANAKVKDEKWMIEHADYFKQKGLRWGHAKPSAKLAGSLWFKRLSDREKDCLVVAEKLGAEYVDFSQGVSRMRTSVNRDTELMFTMCPGQKVFLFGSHLRMMLGRESLTLQGFPWQVEECINNTPETLMTDLSGNAFSLPVIVALLITLLFETPFSTEAAVISDNDDDDDESPSPLA